MLNLAATLRSAELLSPLSPVNFDKALWLATTYVVRTFRAGTGRPALAPELPGSESDTEKEASLCQKEEPAAAWPLCHGWRHRHIILNLVL